MTRPRTKRLHNDEVHQLVDHWAQIRKQARDVIQARRWWNPRSRRDAARAMHTLSTAYIVIGVLKRVLEGGRQGQ